MRATSSGEAVEVVVEVERVRKRARKIHDLLISKMAMHDNGVVVVVCSGVKEREMDVCLASSG